MKRIFFILILVSLYSLQVSSQINKFGSPLSNYFSPDDYNANPRNYAILVNKKTGNLFLGNAQSGVLFYDGVVWGRVPLNNHSIVYSLAQDDNGIVYVGGGGEFGYIDYQSNGGLRYKAISDSIVKILRLENSSVWKTYVYQSKVYFCFVSAIVEYDIKTAKFKVYKLPKVNFLSFLIKNGDIYTGNYNLGLLKLKGDTVIYAPNGKYFKKTDIYSVVDYDDSELLIAYRRYFEESGKLKSVYRISIYNYRTGEVKPFILKSSTGVDLTEKFENTFIYDLKSIDGKYFVIATLGAGAYLIDKSGIVWEEYSTRTGFVNDYAISIFADKNIDNIGFWVTFDNGFYRINSFLPVRKFDESYGIKDVVKKTFVFDGKLHLSFLSYYGYFDIKDDIPVFKKVNIPELGNATIITSILPYEMSKDKKGILLGSSNGLASIENNKYNLISNKYIVNFIYPSQEDSSVFFVGHENGLLVLRLVNEKWIIETPFKFLDKNTVYSITQNRENLWVSTISNGIYKINLTDYSYQNFEANKNGLPNSSVYLIDVFNENVLIGTQAGLFRYNNNSKKFTPIDFFNLKLNTKSINFLSNINNKLWVIANYKIHLIYNSSGEELKHTSSIFNALPLIQPIENFMEKDGIAYFSMSKGFFSVILDSNKYLSGLLNYSFGNKRYPIVRESFVNSDSTFFYGIFTKPFVRNKDTVYIPVQKQTDYTKFIFPFRDRNIVFKIAYPEYSGEIKYSFFLEGFSKNWSKWSENDRYPFTNLKEGNYVLRVRAKDVFGNISNITEIKFTILPPWYRTWWAYIIYVVLIILIIYSILKYYTRKLERDKKRLEEIVRQRTAEIARKNEQLQELVDEVTEQKKIIEEKNKDITDSIKYAEQIQVAVLPEQWEELKGKIELFIYFKPKDIVSGDFYFVRYLKTKDIFVAAAVDCTGHGVPGAFMSLLGVTFLNDILNKNRIYHSNEILDELREKVIAALNQDSDDEEKKKDGMDISLIEYFVKEQRIEFSGANNPLYLLRNRDAEPPQDFSKEFDEGENEFKLYEFKADRQPIGYSYELKPFSKYDIKVQSGDVVYMFSDGFADQFGGPKGKKYTYKRFKRLFISIAGLPVEEQRRKIAEESKNWIGQSNEEQIDDQLIIGVRFL